MEEEGGMQKIFDFISLFLVGLKYTVRLGIPNNSQCRYKQLLNFFFDKAKI